MFLDKSYERVTFGNFKISIEFVTQLYHAIADPSLTIPDGVVNPASRSSIGS